MAEDVFTILRRRREREAAANGDTQVQPDDETRKLMRAAADRRHERKIARHREYYREHAEELREKDREYYIRNREAILERTRNYRKATPEKQKAYRKTFYDANREAILAKNKEYRDSHKEELTRKHREYVKAHKETVNEGRRRYYKEHREKEIARLKAADARMRAEDPEKYREMVRDKSRRHYANIKADPERYARYLAHRKAYYANMDPAKKAEMMAKKHEKYMENKAKAAEMGDLCRKSA